MDVSALSTLKDPPIVEAVVDFDCDMPLDFDLGRESDRLRHDTKDQYPILEVINRSDITVEGGPDGATSNVKNVVGALRFRSADRSQLIQYRDGGFSFNRLKPYTSFDDYESEIFRCWMQFVALTTPLVLRRLRLRYINELRVPLQNGISEYTKYLNCAVVLTDNGLVNGEFLSRLSVAEEGSGLTGVVVSASRPHTVTYAPVIVDIAVQADMACEINDLNAIAGTLQQLRGFKNKIFASVITDRMLENGEGRP